jgi:hypothetical protein
MFFGLALVEIIILMHTTNISMVWLFVVVYGIGGGATGTLVPLVIRPLCARRFLAFSIGSLIFRFKGYSCRSAVRWIYF